MRKKRKKLYKNYVTTEYGKEIILERKIVGWFSNKTDEILTCNLAKHTLDRQGVLKQMLRICIHLDELNNDQVGILNRRFAVKTRLYENYFIYEWGTTILLTRHEKRLIGIVHDDLCVHNYFNEKTKSREQLVDELKIIAIEIDSLNTEEV